MAVLAAGITMSVPQWIPAQTAIIARLNDRFREALPAPFLADSSRPKAEVQTVDNHRRKAVIHRKRSLKKQKVLIGVIFNAKKATSNEFAVMG